jgi:hypothetical protein
MGRIEKTPLHDCMKPHAFRGPRACVMEFPTIQEPLATIRSEVAAVHMLTMHAVCWSAIAYAQGLATTLLDLLALPYRSMTVVSDQNNAAHQGHTASTQLYGCCTMAVVKTFADTQP